MRRPHDSRPSWRRRSNEDDVYVLDPAKGYRLYQAGSNGQLCFVERTEWEYADYDHTVAYAICYDAGAAQSQLRLAFDVAALRAQGMSAEALKAEIQKRIKAGMYPPPARAGFSYMVEPVMRAHLSMNVADRTTATAPMPHLMYYAPNVTDADVGRFSLTPG